MGPAERAVGKLLLLTAAAHLAVGGVGAALLREPSGFWLLLPQGLLALRAARRPGDAR
jgi:hypothetical protein